MLTSGINVVEKHNKVQRFTVSKFKLDVFRFVVPNSVSLTKP